MHGHQGHDAPSGKTASVFSTGLRLTEAFERAVNEMRIRPGVASEATVANPDDHQAKRLRQTAPEEMTPMMLELWNIFQNTVRGDGIGQPNPYSKVEGADRGVQHVLMSVTGEELAFTF